jgi:diketogulonate reductase-like aldo/keto reductase
VTGDGWTLETWIAHVTQLRATDERLHASTVDMLQREVEHLRELHALQAATNEIHFAQLNENAKRTIEERSHFVSGEAYEPFRDIVLKYMASESGKQSGSATAIHWVVTGVSVLVGLVGMLLAVVSGLGQ